jgi:Rrf2 family nitric oxide-sensitive transcriptional repressor
MLSTTAEYALRAVVWLAAQEEAACTTEQISQATEVPGPYLSKVLQTLGRSGIVRSQRGLGGGFTLAVSPEELTVLQVINAVDPLQRIKSCPLKLKAHGGTLCPLHARLDAAVAMIENAFGKCSIADLFNVPGSQTPLCASVRGVNSEDELKNPGGKG